MKEKFVICIFNKSSTDVTFNQSNTFVFNTKCRKGYGIHFIENVSRVTLFLYYQYHISSWVSLSLSKILISFIECERVYDKKCDDYNWYLIIDGL